MTGFRHQRLLALLLPTLLLTLSACGGGGGTTPPPPGDLLGQGVLNEETGTLDLGPVEVTVAGGVLLDAVAFEARTADLLEALPSGVVQAGNPVEINITSGADSLEEPVTLTFHPENITGGANRLLAVAHYDAENGEYEPLTVLGFDATSVTVESRAFSVFIPVELILDSLPPTYNVPNFDPNNQGWSISNFGSHFSPGGNCLGMAAYTIWFWKEKPAEKLFTKYGDTAARVLISRTHITQSGTWATKQGDEIRAEMTPVKLGQYEKCFLFYFSKPVIQIMKNEPHAGVTYGYTEQGFKFHNPNGLASEDIIPWNDSTGYGEYKGFTDFAIVCKPSTGRNQDFRKLYDDAEAGFRSSAVTITTPIEAAEIADRKVRVQGTVSETTWRGVIIFSAGRRFNGAIVGGRFDMEVPIKNGDNDIIVLAGVFTGSQSSFAPGSGVNAVKVKCITGQRPLLVTMTWNQQLSDVDLYVEEPNHQSAWYGDKETDSGGKLDVDNTSGRGPEHYTIGPTTQEGVYTIRVHYFRDKDANEDAFQRITGKIEILVDEGTTTQFSDDTDFSLSAADSTNGDPGSTGTGWKTIGTVDVLNKTILFTQ